MGRFLAGACVLVSFCWGFALAQDSVPVVTSKDLPAPGGQDPAAKEGTTGPAQDPALAPPKPRKPRRDVQAPETSAAGQVSPTPKPPAEPTPPTGTAEASTGKDIPKAKTPPAAVDGKRIPAFWVVLPPK